MPSHLAEKIPGTITFAFGVALGLLTADLLFLRAATAAGVAPPNPFNLIYWVYLGILVGCTVAAHVLGRLLFSVRSRPLLSFLCGLVSTLPLYFPREAAYEATCAPVCSDRFDAIYWVLLAAFASAAVVRWVKATPTVEPFGLWFRQVFARSIPIGQVPGFFMSRLLSTFVVVVGIVFVVTFLGLVATWFGFFAWTHRIAIQQYAECSALAPPMELSDMERRFGRASFIGLREFGTGAGNDWYEMDPSPGYFLAWSNGIDATVEHGGTRVLAIGCGEGW